MKIVTLIIFFIITVIHLYGSLKNNRKIRIATKPFILLSLMAFYLSANTKFVLVLFLALLFSWLGDVLLIPKGNNWFVFGGISFLIGHIFFVLTYLQDIKFAVLNIYVLALFALLFFVLVIYIFSKLKQYLPRKLFYPMQFYLLINGTMNCFAIYRFISNSTLSALITLVGAILFFISDTSLFFVRFNKNSAMKSHFLVMLTYSLALFLIVLGLL